MRRSYLNPRHIVIAVCGSLGMARALKSGVGGGGGGAAGVCCAGALAALLCAHRIVFVLFQVRSCTAEGRFTVGESRVYFCAVSSCYIK
jgi:hypothetical protein